LTVGQGSLSEALSPSDSRKLNRVEYPDAFFWKSRKASPDDGASVHHSSGSNESCGKDVDGKCQSPWGPRDDPATLQNGRKTDRLCFIRRVRIARKGSLLPTAAERAVFCWDGIPRIVGHLEH
jgi:hypothetical protein